MICFISVFVACSLCLNKGIDSELETADKQATIYTEILPGRMSWTDRELHNVQFFQRMNLFSFKTQRDKYPCAVVSPILLFTNNVKVRSPVGNWSIQSSTFRE